MLSQHAKPAISGTVEPMGWTIGLRVKEFRTGAGLSQVDVARVLALDVTDVALLENGQRQVSNFELGLLSEAFGWDIKEMLGVPAGTGGGARPGGGECGPEPHRHTEPMNTTPAPTTSPLEGCPYPIEPSPLDNCPYD